MNDNHGAACNRDTRLENFAAELTLAAYGVALRHGTAGTWMELELELWMALTDTVNKWEQERLRAAGQSKAARQGLHQRHQ